MRPEDEICPVCGYYCLGKGGHGCIDKPALCERHVARRNDEGYTIEERSMNYENIARVAHETNRAYCQALGDDSQVPWEDAPEWQKRSAINGVAFHHAHPEAGPEHSHNEWLREKEADGWKYGPVKDADKKEHPCFVPYDELPVEQKAKDYIFRGIVHALSGLQ